MVFYFHYFTLSFIHCDKFEYSLFPFILFDFIECCGIPDVYIPLAQEHINEEISVGMQNKGVLIVDHNFGVSRKNIDILVLEDNQGQCRL